jgi:endoribonuclease Dicer
LVFQQHAVLKANIAQPMDMFCGDMGTNLWKRNRWEDIFDKNMIIVCTAEVLRQCLHHSYVSMDRINLLIFDEAHHAKKDHPYARIIKDFYLQAPKTSTLPKVFGMTASPVDARVDPKKAAAELEALLHCEIATAADTTLLQFAASSCVEEQASYYAPLRIPFETPLFSQINNLLKDNKVMRKALLFAFDATRELGAWCSDEMWHFCLEEEELKKLKAKTERKYLEGKNIPLEVLHQQQANLEAAGAMVKAHVFEPPYFRDSEIAHDHLASNLSSKVHLLVAYLRERFKRPTDDKCIVFVKQRYTARLISQLLLQNNVRINHLFVGTLVSNSFGILYPKCNS